MKRIFALLISTGLIISCSGSDDVLKMIVGTYTGQNGDGLFSYEFNQENGQWKALSSAKATEPTFVIFSRDGKYLYAVNETDLENSAVQSYAYDAKNGEMSLISTQTTDGSSPCHLSTNGSLLLASNYGSGNLSVFPLGKKGSIEPHLYVRTAGHAISLSAMTASIAMSSGSSLVKSQFSVMKTVT